MHENVGSINFFDLVPSVPLSVYIHKIKLLNLKKFLMLNKHPIINFLSIENLKFKKII
jgi:hypothetical protein